MNVSDMHHHMTPVTALAAAAITSNTTTSSAIIDTAGYEALEFLLLSGTVTDGAYAVSLVHGNDPALSDGVAVPAENVLGYADYAAADDNAAKKLGYTGKKRYVRLDIVSTGVTNGVDSMAVIALKGMAHHLPGAD